MPIHQQLYRTMECSIVDTVASLLHGVMEHCLARQSRCPDKVDNIQAVRKSSTVLVNFCFLWSMKKISVFQFQETLTLTVSFLENWDLERHSSSGENV